MFALRKCVNSVYILALLSVAHAFRVRLGNLTEELASNTLAQYSNSDNLSRKIHHRGNRHIQRNDEIVFDSKQVHESFAWHREDLNSSMEMAWTKHMEPPGESGGILRKIFLTFAVVGTLLASCGCILLAFPLIYSDQPCKSATHMQASGTNILKNVLPTKRATASVLYQKMGLSFANAVLPSAYGNTTSTLRGKDSLASILCRNFHVILFCTMMVVVWWLWGLLAALLTYNVMLAMVFGHLAKTLHSCCCRRRSDAQDGYYISDKSMLKPDIFEIQDQGKELPSASIYVTVYKEPFDEVLRPTLLQALKVVQHYNRAARAQSGDPTLTKANLIVLDDGLLDVSKEEYAQRKTFYHACGVAYTARPRNGDHGYKREGFFKKSGNLNFVHRLDILRREKNIHCDMAMLRSHQEQMDSINVDMALKSFDLPTGCQCMCCDTQMSPWSMCSELVEPLASVDEQSIKFIQGESDFDITFPQSLGLAEIHGDCSLGDYLMILDNDSWAPEESLLDTVQIMLQDEKIGFVQHATGPLNLNDNMVTQVYGTGVYVFWGVMMPVRAWACPPALLGHNAVFRKKAIEAAGLYHTGRGSDDVATNINMRATTDFKGLFAQLYPWERCFLEGVEGSYTVIASQLRRYGAISHSLVFNPMPDWWVKGLLDQGFKNYIFAPNVSYKEIFDTFLFFFGGVQGTILFCTQMPAMIFAAWHCISTGSLDMLSNRSSSAMIGFLISMGVHALIALLVLLTVPRTQVSGWLVFKFLFLGPPLFASLWWSFTIGFAFDHFFKYTVSYGSTRKDKRAPTFMQLLSYHKFQILVALFIVVPFVVLFFSSALPLYDRVCAGVPMCMLGFSMLLCPFVYEEFTWKTTSDAPAMQKMEGFQSNFECCRKAYRIITTAVYTVYENMVKTLLMRAGDRGIAVVDGMRSLALLWMFSYYALGFWCSWKRHESGWWEWLGTFDAAADEKPAVYIALLQSNLARLARTGSLAADVFLVLSGFLVGRSLIKQREEDGRIHYCTFLVRRWFRMVPVLLVAFFIGSLLPIREVCEYASWKTLPGFYGCAGEQVFALFQLHAVTPLIIALLCPKSDCASGSLRPTMLAIVLFAIFVSLRGLLLWNTSELHDGVRLLPEVHFYKSYFRGSSYICGLFVARLYHISESNENVAAARPFLSKVLSCWMGYMTLLMMFAVAYFGSADSPELLFEWNRQNPQLHCFVFILGRPVFGAMCAYILWRVALKHDESLLLASFLSQRVWAPVSAIAYSSYAMLVVPIVVAAHAGHTFLDVRWGDGLGSFPAFFLFFSVFAAIALVSGFLLHGIVELPFEALRRSLGPQYTQRRGCQ